MALPVRFVVNSAHIKTPSVDQWINGITDASPDEGVSLFELTSGSATDREFVAQQGVVPSIRLSTYDLTLLATCGFAGCAISNSSGTPGFMAWARGVPNQALPAAIGASDHVSLQVSDGLLIPVSVQAAHNQPAKLALHLLTELGTNSSSLVAPMITSSNQTIDDGAGQLANVFTAGCVKYTVSGGSSRLVSGIVSQSVDFGIQVQVLSSDGDVYPSSIVIMSRNPVVTFSTEDVELIADIGSGISVSAFGCYFRAVTPSGQRVAPTTAEHVSVSGTAGMITRGSMAMPHGSPAGVTFSFVPVLDTSLLTVSTTATIPTS